MDNYPNNENNQQNAGYGAPDVSYNSNSTQAPNPQQDTTNQLNGFNQNTYGQNNSYNQNPYGQNN
ncbi:MAG: hypothetical protein Q4F06_02845, partial [Eubacteriales bacterium]|nr:hypothetical protein [Eubacteriales bacterium]